MTSKNPFEIRLEILRMAKEMMDRQYDDATAMWWDSVSQMATLTNKTTSELIEKVKEIQKSKPAMYTPEEMMKNAQELYKFIVTKD